MNETICTIMKRGFLRRYKEENISDEHLDIILNAAMRAPTAGNMMTYLIITVRKEETKKKLAISCDNQPFIAKAPLILIFLADYSKWYKYYEVNGVREFQKDRGETFAGPSAGSFVLAVQDAVIAAENAVIAAESLGIGSCYIGDIMEQKEYHKTLFNLPEYVFPVAMLTLGYYPEDYMVPLKERFVEKYVVFEERYNELSKEDIDDMFRKRDQLFTAKNKYNAKNYAQMHYNFKVKAPFSKEMQRSVEEALKEWDKKE